MGARRLELGNSLACYAAPAFEAIRGRSDCSGRAEGCLLSDQTGLLASARSDWLWDVQLEWWHRLRLLESCLRQPACQHWYPQRRAIQQLIRFALQLQRGGQGRATCWLWTCMVELDSQQRRCALQLGSRRSIGCPPGRWPQCHRPEALHLALPCWGCPAVWRWPGSNNITRVSLDTVSVMRRLSRGES